MGILLLTSLYASDSDSLKKENAPLKNPNQNVQIEDQYWDFFFFRLMWVSGLACAHLD
jgi:hypothetical protein